MSAATILETPARRLSWTQRALFTMEQEESIELQLKLRLSYLGRRERSRLLRRIVVSSLPVEYENELFIDSVAKQAYRDVQETPELAAWVRSKYPDHGPIDLLRLPDVGDNRAFATGTNRAVPTRAVDLVLNIAETNFELMLAALAGGTDVYASRGADVLVQRKLQRSGAQSHAISSFTQLLELNGIPDIGRCGERRGGHVSVMEDPKRSPISEVSEVVARGGSRPRVGRPRVRLHVAGD